MDLNDDHIAAQLAEQSYSVTPGFLTAELLARAAEDLLLLRESGSMNRAALGKERVLRDDLRQDEIFWLDPQSSNSVRTELSVRLDELQSHLNRQLFLGLRSFEAHYAYYPAGGRYVRHLDKFQGQSDREVSVVLYLNRDWKAPDGGRLRLYTKNGPVEVDPLGGTLICFMSGELEHEVLQSHSPRISLAGWFKTS